MNKEFGVVLLLILRGLLLYSTCTFALVAESLLTARLSVVLVLVVLMSAMSVKWIQLF